MHFRTRSYRELLRGLWLFSLPVSGACADETTSPEPPEDFGAIAQRLEGAYRQRSRDELRTVFESWQDAIAPYTHEEMAAFSDTIQQVYAVFQEFYSPTDLNRITGGAHEDFETDFWYIVVQNSMRFAVVDTGLEQLGYPEATAEEEILDFRPPQGNLPLPVVYLSTQADSTIYRYLYQPDGTRESDHRDRVDFLRQTMQLTHHHWINDYHKATMPVVSALYMNGSLTEAKLAFRVFYQFGEAYLERRGSGWTITSSELRWIE